MRNSVIMCALLAAGCAPKSGLTAKAPCVSTQRYVSVSAHGGTTCAVRDTGELDCWGIDYGRGRPFRRDDIRSVALGVTDARRVDVGGKVCVERNGDADPVCFGPSVEPVSAKAPIARIASGSAASCALTKSGFVFCWGRNKQGEVGVAEPRYREVRAPVHLEQLTEMRQIDLGTSHGCGVDASARAWCWGKGRMRLGRSAYSGSLPEPIQLDEVLQVTAGNEHSCALVQGGSVRCWGRNDKGQLGGEGKSSWLPVEVAAVKQAKMVAAGTSHTCAVLTSGEVACWGDERRREKRGVRVVSLVAPATEVAAASQHDCALLADGRLACWGRRAPRVDASCK